LLGSVWNHLANLTLPKGAMSEHGDGGSDRCYGGRVLDDGEITQSVSSDHTSL
jgi:hypothetical protein